MTNQSNLLDLESEEPNESYSFYYNTPRPKKKPVPLTAKTVLLGDSGVGKTAFTNVFVQDQSSSEMPTSATIGSNFTIKQIFYTQKFCDIEGNLQEKDIIVNFEIWDTCGQERYRSIAPSYYRLAKLVLLFFSIDNKKSYNSIDYWREQIQNYVGNKLEIRPVICIVANKIDLIGSTEAQFNRKELDIIKIDMLKLDFLYAETSALEKKGIHEIFPEAARELDIDSLLKAEELIEIEQLKIRANLNRPKSVSLCPC